MAITIDERMFHIRTEDPSIEVYQEFKKFILNGELDRNGELFKIISADQTLVYFFEEVSFIRKFWLLIDEIQSSSSPIQ